MSISYHRTAYATMNPTMDYLKCTLCWESLHMSRARHRMAYAAMNKIIEDKSYRPQKWRKYADTPILTEKDSTSGCETDADGRIAQTKPRKAGK